MEVTRPAKYISVLNTLKEKIRQARIRAALSVNTALVTTYWEIGSAIIQQQREEGWGSKIIDRLATDLKLEFPEMQGLSVRNFKYMKAFAEAYPYFPKVQATLAQEIESQSGINETLIVQEGLAQLSWYTHITLLAKVKDPEARLFYINKCIENGWSRDVLVHQIESNLYARQGSLINNFKATVPAHQSEAMQQVFKDPYYFDFLQLGEEVRERDLENALTQHIVRLLLELGDGFAFKGRQFRLEVDGQEYFIDLLFYHTKLRRHIVIELKIGDFQSEFAGKMNLYLGIVDDFLKGEYDESSIGLILCKTKSKIVAEYALRDTSKPIGIAEYRLAEKLPDDIKGELPSIEEIEQKLDQELKESSSNLENRFKAIKEKLKAIRNDEIQTSVTSKILIDLYKTGVRILYEQLIAKMGNFEELFHSQNYSWSYQNVSVVNLEQLDSLWSSEERLREVHEINFHYSLLGFKKAGIQDFNDFFQLRLTINTYWYGFSLINYNHGQPFLKKLYHQSLTSQDRQLILDTVVDKVMDRIDWFIESLG